MKGISEYSPCMFTHTLLISVTLAYKHVRDKRVGGNQPIYHPATSVLDIRKSRERSTMRQKIRMLVGKIQILVGLFSTHWGQTV